MYYEKEREMNAWPTASQIEAARQVLEMVLRSQDVAYLFLFLSNYHMTS